MKAQVDVIDDLFVACGTGTTLTGICAGMQAFFPNATVHGISVARSCEAEFPVLVEDMELLNQYLGTSYDFSKLDFHDEFLCGGYAKSCEEEAMIIKECISNEGMVIDPTYVGKAFYGMLSLLTDKKYRGRKILFWNTGGLINLLSQKEVFGI